MLVKSSLHIFCMILQGYSLSPCQMPCLCSTHHRHHCHFLPHFPPRSMQCQFSLELVSPLPHAMREVFPKSEGDPICGSPTSPLSPLTLTGSSPPLIPKPSGEVSRIGHGGYTLKNVLEQEHKWEDGLYQKIRVYNVILPQLVISCSSLFRKKYALWPMNIWIHPFPIPLRQQSPRIDSLKSVNLCSIFSVIQMYN